MLGWQVLVFRGSERSADTPEGESIASWKTGTSGLQWLYDLVQRGEAVDLGGNGYPNRYSIVANVLLPIISSGLPLNDGPAVIGDDYFFPKGWSTKVKLDRQKIAVCPADAQLLIEQWDLS